MLRKGVDLGLAPSPNFCENGSSDVPVWVKFTQEKHLLTILGTARKHF